MVNRFKHKKYILLIYHVEREIGSINLAYLLVSRCFVHIKIEITKSVAGLDRSQIQLLFVVLSLVPLATSWHCLQAM